MSCMLLKDAIAQKQLLVSQISQSTLKSFFFYVTKLHPSLT